VKKARQTGVKLEIFPGTQLHKMESLKPIRGIYEINQKLEYRNELDRNDTVLVTIHHFLFQFSLK
jgi:fido (protein-threonine AMPylation protein)